MPKELILYTPIYSSSAEAAVRQLSEIPENEDFTIRMNTPGGEVTAGWSIISKLSEMKGYKTLIIDGQAASMGAIMLMYFDEVIANDTSEIMFHQAAYPSWYEPTDQEKRLLEKINAQFKEKLSKKVKGRQGADKFLSEVFEEGKRNDVYLTMDKAKRLGIVDEIRKLDPKAYSGTQMVALFEGNKLYTKETPKASGENNNNQKIKSMDLNQLKAEHPALYQEIFGLGEKAGAEKEHDRVQAWGVFMEIDPKKVKTGIDSDKLPSAKDVAEFQLAAVTTGKMKAIEDENPPKTDTDEGNKGKTEEQIKAEADAKALEDYYKKSEKK